MEETYERIETILKAHVRPVLARHGGDIRLVEIRNGTAYVKLTGHCSSCPSAKYTLESIVKEELLKYTDEVEEVKLQEEVSQELYEFAKKILHAEI